MHLFTLLSATLLAAVASAHFHLVYPAPRGENESGTQYPCGGINTPSTERTMFPLSGAPILIDDEHTEALVSVVLAIGELTMRICDEWRHADYWHRRKPYWRRLCYTAFADNRDTRTRRFLLRLNQRPSSAAALWDVRGSGQWDERHDPSQHE